MSHQHIAFSDMTQEERQLFIDFQFKEMERHLSDILNIKNDLRIAKDKYGIEPRWVWVGKWIDVK